MSPSLYQGRKREKLLLVLLRSSNALLSTTSLSFLTYVAIAPATNRALTRCLLKSRLAKVSIQLGACASPIRLETCNVKIHHAVQYSTHKLVDSPGTVRAIKCATKSRCEVTCH
jgi:hypothetical protein